MPSKREFEFQVPEGTTDSEIEEIVDRRIDEMTERDIDDLLKGFGSS